MHNNSKYQSIDYDAIMKSIKITHTTNEPPTMQTHKTPTLSNPKSLSVSRLMEPNQSSIAYTKEFLMKPEPKVETNNFIYSSIIQDDLSKEQCFESVLREMKNTYPLNEVEFQFYDQDKIQENHNQNRTPTRFRKFKQSNYRQLHENSEEQPIKNKQNNSRYHNKCLEQKPNQQEIHRYLSHTETSQKKIKPKKQAIVEKSVELKPRPTSMARQKRQNKKPGIEIIKQKYYRN